MSTCRSSRLPPSGSPGYRPPLREMFTNVHNNNVSGVSLEKQSYSSLTCRKKVNVCNTRGILDENSERPPLGGDPYLFRYNHAKRLRAIVSPKNRTSKGKNHPQTRDFSPTGEQLDRCGWNEDRQRNFATETSKIDDVFVYSTEEGMTETSFIDTDTSSNNVFVYSTEQGAEISLLDYEKEDDVSVDSDLGLNPLPLPSSTVIVSAEKKKLTHDCKNYPSTTINEDKIDEWERTTDMIVFGETPVFDRDHLMKSGVVIYEEIERPVLENTPQCMVQYDQAIQAITLTGAYSTSQNSISCNVGHVIDQQIINISKIPHNNIIKIDGAVSSPELDIAVSSNKFSSKVDKSGGDLSCINSQCLEQAEYFTGAVQEEMDKLLYTDIFEDENYFSFCGSEHLERSGKHELLPELRACLKACQAKITCLTKDKDDMTRKVSSMRFLKSSLQSTVDIQESVLKKALDDMMSMKMNLQKAQQLKSDHNSELESCLKASNEKAEVLYQDKHNLEIEISSVKFENSSLEKTVSDQEGLLQKTRDELYSMRTEIQKAERQKLQLMTINDTEIRLRKKITEEFQKLHEDNCSLKNSLKKFQELTLSSSSDSLVSVGIEEEEGE